MHSKIYQITTEKLTDDGLISASTFDYEATDFADYVANLEDYEQEAYLKDLDYILKGIFSREGRELTYLGAENFVNEWLAFLKEYIAIIRTEDMKDFYNRYKLKSFVNYTHREFYTRFYLGAEWETSAEPFGDFIMNIYGNYQPGQKFYVGGIVDFHF